MPYNGNIEHLSLERLPDFDCHCHLLPGLDDGAKDTEESICLASILASVGFRRIVCTSHSTYVYRNTPQTVIPACMQLQDELERRGIDLHLIPSMEYRLIPETWPEIRRNGWLLPWDGNHILIELPIRRREQMGDIDMIAEVRTLLADGYQPVLAHPERYLWAGREEYERLFDAGAGFQRNLGSLEGVYGPDCAARANTLLRWGFYSFVGTDTHDKRYTDMLIKMKQEGNLIIGDK